MARRQIGTVFDSLTRRHGALQECLLGAGIRNITLHLIGNNIKHEKCNTAPVHAYQPHEAGEWEAIQPGAEQKCVIRIDKPSGTLISNIRREQRKKNIDFIRLA